MEKSQLIFYDNDTMECYNIYNYLIGFDFSAIGDIENAYPTIRGLVECDFEGRFIKSPINLDPTTMKRIAKYNSEMEVKELEKQKTQLNSEISKLKTDLDKIKNKIDNLKNFAENFIKSDIDNIEDYIDVEYNDDKYDDYYGEDDD
jgi:predicted nuclease with TOPRIM domain